MGEVRMRSEAWKLSWLCNGEGNELSFSCPGGLAMVELMH
jgi:hypothetical protein